MAVNSAVPRMDSQLQPDIVITDEARKKFIMVEVMVPFEDGTQAFCDTRAQKEEKDAAQPTTP